MLWKVRRKKIRQGNDQSTSERERERAVHKLVPHSKCHQIRGRQTMQTNRPNWIKSPEIMKNKKKQRTNLRESPKMAKLDLNCRQCVNEKIYKRISFDVKNIRLNWNSFPVPSNALNIRQQVNKIKNPFDSTQVCTRLCINGLMMNEIGHCQKVPKSDLVFYAWKSKRRAKWITNNSETKAKERTKSQT